MRPSISLLLAALGAACAGSPDASVADSGVAHSGVADTTATVAPAPADSARWAVTHRGAGPLEVGMTAAAVERALGAALERSAAMNGCEMIGAPGGPAGLSLMLVHDTLVRVDVTDTLPRTRDGVGVGSGEEAVRAAYGSRVTAGPHKYDAPPARYLTVVSPDDTTRAIVFETDGRRVTRYRAGRRPEVEWVEGCA